LEEEINTIRNICWIVIVYTLNLNNTDDPLLEAIHI